MSVLYENDSVYYADPCLVTNINAELDNLNSTLIELAFAAKVILTYKTTGKMDLSDHLKYRDIMLQYNTKQFTPELLDAIINLKEKMEG